MTKIIYINNPQHKQNKIYNKNFNFLNYFNHNFPQPINNLLKNKKNQKIKIYYKYNNYLKIKKIIKIIQKNNL
jgi:hypothetical protein